MLLAKDITWICSFWHESPPSDEASSPDGAVLRFRGKACFSTIYGRRKDGRDIFPTVFFFRLGRIHSLMARSAVQSAIGEALSGFRTDEPAHFLNLLRLLPVISDDQTLKLLLSYLFKPYGVGTRNIVKT